MRLSPTAVIVLGLVERLGEATPYDLKQAVSATVGNFWSIPHSQLYAEPDRLTAAGLLDRRQERTGRRRKTYSLTSAGRAALDDWREDPATEAAEMREPALLKLFFDADPAEVARGQLEVHRRKLEQYRAQQATDDGSGPRGPWIALEAGVRHTVEWIAYWEEIARTGGIRRAPLGTHSAMTENEGNEQERDITGPPEGQTHEASSPPGSGDRDDDEVQRSEEKLDQAGGGH